MRKIHLQMINITISMGVTSDIFNKQAISKNENKMDQLIF